MVVTPAAPASAPAIVDVAIVGGDDEELKEMAKGLIAEDPGLKPRIFEPSSPHELFATLRQVTRDGRKIGKLILAAHGDRSHYLGLSEALLPKHVDLAAIRAQKREAQRAATAHRVHAEEYRPLLAGMKSEEDRRKLQALIEREEELAKREEETFQSFEQQETDLLGVADVMAEGGVVLLINCCPASDPAGLKFMRNLGRVLLAKRGGRILGAAGDVHLLQIQNLAQSWKHGADIGEYVMWGEGGWVSLPIEKAPDSGFVLGKLFVAGEVFRISGSPPATDPLVKRASRLLLAGAGHFKKQWWGPEGRSGPPPEAIKYGPVHVPGPGTLRMTMQVDPPNPGGWTVVNSEAAISSSVSGREDGTETAAVSASTGQWTGTRMALQVETCLSGWLRVEVEPPVSYGYYGGSHPEQSFAFQIEFLDAEADAPSLSGLIRDGDRFKTGYSRAVLCLSNGVRILLREHSEVALQRTAAGIVRGQVTAGGVHVIGRKGVPHDVEYELRGWLLRPGGTVFAAQPGDDGTPLEVARQYDRAPLARVYEGWIDAGGPGATQRVEAGQEIDLVTGEVREMTQREPDDVFDQIPLGELLLDDTPEPCGSRAFELVPGRLPDGWTWQDPLKTGFNATPSTWEIDAGGTLRVTTQPGVDFDGNAPWLMHKVSGDFDLDVRVAVSAPGEDEARTRFLLYAPGSYLLALGGWQRVVGKKRAEGLSTHSFPLAGRIRCGPKSTVGDESYAISPSAEISGVEEPLRLKLSRRGDRFAVAWSPDGTAWISGPDETLAGAPETLYAGLLFEHETRDSFQTTDWGNRSELTGLRLHIGPSGGRSLSAGLQSRR